MARHPARARNRVPVRRGPGRRRRGTRRPTPGRSTAPGTGASSPRPGPPPTGGTRAPSPSGPPRRHRTARQPPPGPGHHVLPHRPAPRRRRASPCTRPSPGTPTPSAPPGTPGRRGQLMADALVERTTGTPGGISGIEIQLVMTDRTLFQGDSRTRPAPRLRHRPRRLGPHRSQRHEPARAPASARNGTRAPDGARNRHRRRHSGNGHARDTAGDEPSTSGSAGSTPPRHRRAHRDGLPRPALPARAPPLHPGPGRHLPHPLLRRPHPPPGPHHPLAPRRPDHPDQRRRTLRSLQPHQRNPRLDRPTPHPDPGTPSNSPPPPATPTTPPRHPCRGRRFAHQPRDQAQPAPATGASSGTRPKRSGAKGPKWQPQPRTIS